MLLAKPVGISLGFKLQVDGDIFDGLQCKQQLGGEVGG